MLNKGENWLAKWKIRGNFCHNQSTLVASLKMFADKFQGSGFHDGLTGVERVLLAGLIP
jgi:hypothetical protein